MPSCRFLIFKNRAKIRVVNRWTPTSYRPEGPVSRWLTRLCAYFSRSLTITSRATPKQKLSNARSKPIHKGDKTHNQLHWIWLVNLRPINRMVSNGKKDEIFIFIYVFYLIMPQAFLNRAESNKLLRFLKVEQRSSTMFSISLSSLVVDACP